MTTNIEAHLMGRLAVGASLFSTYNQQIGIHSRLLLARQSIDSKWMPNFSIGFRNLGSSPLQDRYVSGDRRVRDILPAAQRAGAGVINGAPSFYGVATREFTGDRTSLGLTMGYGTGLFRNDGGLGTKYNKSGTLVPGLFLGGRYAVALSDKSTLGLMLENDAWDWNVGAHVTMGHLTVGVMLAEVEEAKGIPPGEPLANWTKTNLMVAYSGSIPDIVRNSRQRSESVELELEAQRLKREVAQRARRMRELQRDIAGAQTRADADAKAQEAALLKALDAEREAAKRAAERLKAVKPDGKPDGTP
jgi:hypothetical protein